MKNDERKLSNIYETVIIPFKMGKVIRSVSMDQPEQSSPTEQPNQSDIVSDTESDSSLPALPEPNDLAPNENKGCISISEPNLDVNASISFIDNNITLTIMGKNGSITIDGKKIDIQSLIRKLNDVIGLQTQLNSPIY